MKYMLVLLAACTGVSSHPEPPLPAPVAHDDHVAIAEDGNLPLDRLTANDEHAENAFPRVDSMPAHGVIDEFAGYEPDPGFHGVDTFTYELAGSVASVTVDVTSDGIPYEQAKLLDHGDERLAATGDLDGDGKPDLVEIDLTNHSLLVELDRSTPGHLDFAPALFDGGHDPRAVALADVDGDGRLDMIVASGTDGVLLMHNVPVTGGLGFEGTVLATGDAVAVTAADIDQDGRLDIAAVDDFGDELDVWLNRSTGWTSPARFATGAGPSAVIAIDIDHAGGIDLAVLARSAAELALFKNATAVAGPVAFAARVDRTTGQDPEQLLAADLDGDGAPELAVLGADSSLRVYSNAVAAFGASRLVALDYAYARAIAAVDLDHAGAADLVVGYDYGAVEQLISTDAASFAFTSRDAIIGVGHAREAPASATAIVKVDLAGVPPDELVITSDYGMGDGQPGTFVLYGD